MYSSGMQGSFERYRSWPRASVGQTHYAARFRISPGYRSACQRRKHQPLVPPLGRINLCGMSSPLEHISLRTITGAASSLADYSGKVRLVVNVASRCGLTPQYSALEALYRRFRDRGFEVLAFPANDFAQQEPGSEAEIQEFCTTNYDVSFPLFAKIAVKGDAQHPLYAELTSQCPKAKELPGSDFRSKLANYGIVPASAHEVLWNFEKFLIDRSGSVVERFAPDVPPDSELVVSAIERTLA